MTTSVAAFVYGSFDPQLYVSVDKPAPGLWPQAIAVKLFGFSGLTLLLPQALCGIASVAVLFRIVARIHGLLAGTLAALALAVAPVAVAVDRNNTMDAELVLVLLLAVWCLLRSLDGGARWLVAAAALVGVGFNVKMSAAYLVVPAIAGTYLLASRARPLARVAHIVAFAVAAVAASAPWIALVDLTPADARPYVGSSRTNSALELALGHNGLARLPQELPFGPRDGPAPQGPPPGAPQPPAGTPGSPQGGPVQPFGPTAEAGERGPLRLLNAELAGQVSWYLPLAIAGALAILLRARHLPLDAPAASAVLWLLWLVPGAILFSWSGIFHRYYLVMLAPPLAALVGAGVAVLVPLARARLAWRAAVVATAVATAALHAAILLRAGAFAPWLADVAIAGALAAVAAVSLPGGRRIAAAVAIAAVFAGPTAWAATTVGSSDPGLPYAGPELLARRAPPRVGGAPQASRLLDFLVAERRGERWAAATSSQGTASSLMLRSDVAIMALGGFSGGDPILTPATLEATIRSGALRFVLVEERMPRELERWVRARCAPVPPARTGPLGLPAAPGQAPPSLFDCRGVRDAK